MDQKEDFKQSEAERKNGPLAVLYHVFLEVAIGLAVDVGAILWLTDFVAKSRAFSYALLVLVGLVLVLLTVSYFLWERLPKAANGYDGVCACSKTISVLLGIAFVGMLTCVVCQAIGGSLNQAGLAHVAYRMCGILFRDEGATCLEALNEAIGHDEGNVIYLVERGDLLVQICDDKRSDDVVTHSSEKGVSYSEEDCLRHAISDYTTAALKDQDNPEYVFKRGVAYAKRGNGYADECLADLRAAIALDAANPAYCLKYAKRLIDMGDGRQETLAEARAYLDKAAGASSDSELDYYLYYLRALQSVEDESARRAGISLFARVSEEVVGDEMDGIANQLQNFLGKNEDLADEMVEHLERASAGSPDSLGLKCEYGVALRMSGRLGEAVACFNEVIGEDPTFFAAYEQRALAQNSLCNYDDSIQDISVSIQHNDIARCHSYRGDVLYNKGECGKAVDDYLRAVDMGTNMSAYCYYSAGQACRRLEDYSAAMTYLSKSIPEGLNDTYKVYCYGDWADSEYHLGSKSRDDGDADGAKEHYAAAASKYHEAIRWSNNDELTARYYYWVGRAHDNLGEYQNALEDYQRACELVHDEDYESALQASRERLNLE